MARRSSMRRRLERLEAARQRQASPVYREAWVEMCAGNCVETHVETTSTVDDGRWYFEELPGPGPQLSDFGQFSLVMYLTTAEMNF